MGTEVFVNNRVSANSKLRELFVDQLKDIHWAENKLVKALDKMRDAATSLKLKSAFNTHREETVEQVARLQRVFASIDEPVGSAKCPAMAGIIEEANDIMDDTDEGTSQRDAGLVIAAQKAEHYEIATYGSLAQLAEVLGYSQAKELLRTTLDEEKAADHTLTGIAKSGINYEAAMEQESQDVS